MDSKEKRIFWYNDGLLTLFVLCKRLVHLLVMLNSIFSFAVMSTFISVNNSQCVTS